MSGVMKGSIIHIHRARSITVDGDGLISASELGNSVSFVSFICSAFSIWLL